MEFACYLCKKTSKISNDIIVHLKRAHNIKENTQFNCIKNYPSCKKTFSTFKGLSLHAKKCIVQNENVSCEYYKYDSMRETIVYV